MDVLSDILSRMQVAGTLYFRTSFTSPWSIRVPSFKDVARFHFAHKGACFVRVNSSSETVLVEQGDLIIVPRGAEHTLFCDPETEGQAVHLDQVVDDSGFTGHSTLVYGELGSDQETQLVCGHFAFAEHTVHPLLESLPDCLQIKHYGEVAGSWMESTLKLIGTEGGRDGIGGDFIALRMSEIILAQALRTFLVSEEANTPLFAGFIDPSISSALRAIHENPSGALTLQALSEVACLSRTAFVTRFTNCMSMTPLKYVTYWRMQIAKQQLTQTSLPVLDIAESVGYQSETSFGRVFKKHNGVTPVAYRRHVNST